MIKKKATRALRVLSLSDAVKLAALVRCDNTSDCVGCPLRESRYILCDNGPLVYVRRILRDYRARLPKPRQRRKS